MPKKAKAPKGCFWRGDVLWGRIQVDGTDHKRSLRTAVPAEAKAARSAWAKELIRASSKLSGDRHGWPRAVERWSVELMPGLKPSAAKRYLCSLSMVRPVLDHLFLDQIGRAELAAIAGRQGPSIATRRRDLDAVAVVLYAAEAWGWIDEAPDLKKIRRGLKERRDPIRPPSDEDVAAVLAVMPPNFCRLIDFLDRTGMRMEEAASLERASVDWQKGEAQLWATKTSRPRRIALQTIVADAFALVETIPPRIGCKWLFHHKGLPRADGQPPTAERFKNVSSRFAGYCRKAKRKFRLHDLRHRFAYRWLRAGGDIYELSRHLGHANVKVTDQIYGGWARRGSEHGPEQKDEVA